MPLTLAELRDIQSRCYADDIAIEERMHAWTEQQVVAFFESGGEAVPATAATPGPATAVFEDSSTERQPPPFSVVKIFGDSHANTFISLEATDARQRMLAYPYTAGSAMGLRHADSITGYRSALEGDLHETQSSDAIVLKFGQVDCDFVYYLKRAEDQTLTFDAFAADAVAKYFTFIDSLLQSSSLPVDRSQLHIVRRTHMPHNSMPPPRLRAPQAG